MALIYAVEDDKNILEIEMFALKNSGYQVEGFECARDFYKKLEEKQPDLALLDIMLPDEDGLEIVAKLRRRPETKKLLIDSDVLKDEYFGCHPCINTTSMKLKTSDIMEKFLPAVHHEPTIVDLPWEE